MPRVASCAHIRSCTNIITLYCTRMYMGCDLGPPGAQNGDFFREQASHEN